MAKRVAVVLAGCGVFDGTEIDHLKDAPTPEKRSVLVESARLARGDIQDLAERRVKDFDAITFPRSPDVPGTAEATTQLGCKHICKNVNEAHVDEKNKIVTSCAFICKAPLHEIFDGVGVMIQSVLSLA